MWNFLHYNHINHITLFNIVYCSDLNLLNKSHERIKKRGHRKILNQILLYAIQKKDELLGIMIRCYEKTARVLRIKLRNKFSNTSARNYNKRLLSLLLLYLYTSIYISNNNILSSSYSKRLRMDIVKGWITIDFQYISLLCQKSIRLLFLQNTGGFQWSMFERGYLEPLYAYVNFFPPVNSVSWWKAAFEWGGV